MKHPLARQNPLASIVSRLLDRPDVVEAVRALPTAAFSALVREVGVEDAGEIVALATAAQLVGAFDEDLFGNVRPGERERFDADRFALWLEVLLEAGDEVAASRVAELSEDFVTQALSALVLVLDQDALRDRMSEGGHDARRADKALESALCEEIDGYLLVARRAQGWDAALALIVALDRDHRDLLVRVLDRAAGLASDYVDDLDALSDLLTAEESLADDVEAERESRRAAQGFVEPRAARSFLALARSAGDSPDGGRTRDPVARAYFRELARAADARAVPASAEPAPDWTAALDDAHGRPALPAGPKGAARAEVGAFGQAMRLLGEGDPRRFDARLEELAFLANVLVAGAELEGRRFRPGEAAEAALATVGWGAELAVRAARAQAGKAARRATAAELRTVLAETEADRLFRRASAALATEKHRAAFLRSRDELDALCARAQRRPRRRAS